MDTKTIECEPFKKSYQVLKFEPPRDRIQLRQAQDQGVPYDQLNEIEDANIPVPKVDSEMLLDNTEF